MFGVPNLPCGGFGVVGRQLSREREPRFKNSTLASLCSLQRAVRASVRRARPTARGRRHGVAAQLVATAVLAPPTEYTIADHRHAPSKHNSSTDKRLQRRRPVYLPTPTWHSAQLSMYQHDPLSKATYSLNTGPPKSLFLRFLQIFLTAS